MRIEPRGFSCRSAPEALRTAPNPLPGLDLEQFAIDARRGRSSQSWVALTRAHLVATRGLNRLEYFFGATPRSPQKRLRAGSLE